MQYPMRVYGLNLFEACLSALLKWVAWFALLFAAASVIWRYDFYPTLAGATAATLALLATCILLMLAGAGIRQNRAILDAAVVTATLTAIGLVLAAFIFGLLVPGIAGGLLILSLIAILVIRRHALLARFKPRFFTLRQFSTMIRIADTMIDGDGKAAMNPIQIAIGVDHMFSRIDSPAAIKEIRLVMFLVEWLLPILSGWPVPFSDLGTNERQQLVEKVIGSNKIFKNVAKVLKLFACAGYYGSPAGMAQTGYIPFDQRERAKGLDKTPLPHPDPFKQGGPLYGKI